MCPSFYVYIRILIHTFAVFVPGYEIALTARKRAWSATVRGKLGRAYVQGKIQWARTRKNSRATTTSYISTGSVDLMLTDGLERSIESELGLQLKDFFPSSSGGSSGANQGSTTSGGSKNNGVGRQPVPGERQFSSLGVSRKAWKVPDRIRIQFTNDTMNTKTTNSGGTSGSKSDGKSDGSSNNSNGSAW